MLRREIAEPVTRWFAARTLADFHLLDAILDIAPEAVAVPAEVQRLVEERLAARTAKDWARSDQLREAIAALGWAVKDTKAGSQLHRT